MKKLVSALCLFIALLISGCGGGGTSTPTSTGPVTSTARAAGSLQMTLSTPKSVYARGEAIPLTLTVLNTETRAVTYTYNDSSVEFVAAQSGKQISSFPSLNGNSIFSETVAPKATSTSQLTWNQTDANQHRVTSGQYTITAYIPIRMLDNTDLLHSIPADSWMSFWQTNYAANPITITIR